MINCRCGCGTLIQPIDKYGRLVYEQYNKCCLLSWSVIHHINGIKTDNRIENLEPIINNGVHHLLHHNHERDPKTGRFISVLV